MRLTGNEYVGLEVKGDLDTHFTICELTLNSLLNTFIRDNLCSSLQKNDTTEHLITQNIFFEDLETKRITKITKGIKIDVVFQVSLENNIIDHNTYTATHKDLDIKDFYNSVAQIFEDYAYELDTDIDNVKLTISELNIKDWRVLTYEN